MLDRSFLLLIFFSYFNSVTLNLSFIVSSFKYFKSRAYINNICINALRIDVVLNLCLRQSCLSPVWETLIKYHLMGIVRILGCKMWNYKNSTLSSTTEDRFTKKVIFKVVWNEFSWFLGITTRCECIEFISQ